MDNIKRFIFLADALNASGGFADGSYLISYPRESGGKYAARQQVAWYRNFLRSACGDFVGYLSKRPPVRDTTQPLFKVLLDDADGKGNALDVFWQGFMVDAKARGSMLLAVDMPKQLPGTLADQLRARAVPYLTPIKPEQVVAYQINEDGSLALVAIPYAEPASYGTLSAPLNLPKWKVWTETEWRIQEPGIDGAVHERQPHPLGVCPVLVFTEKGDFPSCGDFAQIADLSKRHYNLCSERDEILRAQTFSLLTYQVPPEQAHLFDGKQVAEAIGTHNLLTHNGGTPSFIAPPDGPATIYNQVIADLEASIRKIALTIEQPTSQESGLALTIRFQQLNSALASFARKMEDLERRMWWLVSLWLGQSQPPNIVWSKDYSLADVATELAELQQLQLSAFPQTVIDEKQKQIIGLMLANLAPDQLDKLMADVGGEHVSEVAV